MKRPVRSRPLAALFKRVSEPERDRGDDDDPEGEDDDPGLQAQLLAGIVLAVIAAIGIGFYLFLKR